MAIVGAYSDKGLVKSVDQDACCYLELQSSVGPVSMAIVCDGVGGLDKGELASTTVVQRFSQWFDTQLPTFLDFNRGAGQQVLGTLSGVWDTLLQAANSDILAYGNREGTLLGTTFTGLIAFCGHYLIGHVGDCRAYEITATGCRQLTRDQTLAMQALAEGRIRPDEVVSYPQRNVIMQAVGTQEGIKPDFVTGTYDPGAVYMLCCDGFYNRLSEDELRAVLSPSAIADEHDLQASCAQLARMAMGRGEKDNITVLAFTDAPSRGGGF